MLALLDRVACETPSEFDYEWLGKFVRSIDVPVLDYKAHLPALGEPGKYTRNILILEPFEVVLLHWPAGVESAVHLHKGFWGYVLCLEGQIDNITYQFEGDQLHESVVSRATPGGIIAEPDGTIHKIVNSSATEPLVTLHFYYPALDTLDGLMLFDLETGTVGELNAEAQTASFAEPDVHFRRLDKGAFTFQTAGSNGKSHRIFPILPKPSSETIRELISAYYAEQAAEYDSFDLNHTSRKRYTESINQLIAGKLRQLDTLDTVLDIACGTGRRSVDIRELSGKDYALHGLDLSGAMAEVAEQRGIEPHVGAWQDVDLEGLQVDAITFLYAYGHIPSEVERAEALVKIYRHLRPGGFLFFDVFNARDQFEWGPKAIAYFERHGLIHQGYERGDVFYRKTGGKEVAFLHYCEEAPMRAFLEAQGFEVVSVTHIGYTGKPGQILDNPDEGSLFFHCRKPQDT